MADLTGALQAAAGTAASAGGAADPNFNQTVLLLHGDGTNGAQNNTFLDSSTNNFTITRNGNTTQGSFSPFSVADGEWSAYFDGTNDYISVPDSADFTMGNGDWTIEAWIYSTRSGTTEIIWGNANSAGSGSSTAFQLYKVSNKIIAFVHAGANKDVTSTADCPLNQWFHVAMVRDGTNLRLYVNGVEAASPTDLSTTALVDSADPVAVGRSGSYNASYFQGFVSNFSIIKGTCLYPSGTTFTPPSSPLSTSTSGQSVLLCTANRFIDTNTATTAKTVTVAGPLIQPFSPFAPSAAYSPSVNGGSGYFDGSGDSVVAASNAAFGYGTGDYQIDFWLYKLTSSDAFLIDQRTADNQATVCLYITSNTIRLYLSGADRITGTTTISTNTWYFVTLSRVSGTTRLFVNGVQDGSSYSDTTNYITAPVKLGNKGPTPESSALTGYLASTRIIKGSGVSSQTIPTSPLTAVSGTELLLNFTNAGILDNTGKNNLETVGNAQIDTTTKKYGTGSMEFDGTGDYLVGPNQPWLNFGTGDFTIECWLQLNSTATAMMIVTTNYNASTGGGGWAFIYRGDISSLSLSVNANVTYTKSWSPSTGVWYHIAVARSGTDLKLFVDGTQIGTTSTSSDNITGATTLVVANNLGGAPELPLNGYIDDLRISRVARYTANFTPPDAPFLDQ